MRNRAPGQLFLLLILALCVLCAACKPFERFKNPSGESLPADGTAGTPLFVIRSLSGPEPFWFELGSAGPRLIPSPAEASLEPLLPWTEARHITGFLPGAPDGAPSGGPDGTPGGPSAGENRGSEWLYAAVNRGGMAVIERREPGGPGAPNGRGAPNGGGPAETALYYYPGGPVWERYPAVSFFRAGGAPAVLLAGDRFFSEAAPAPDPAVWVLEGVPSPLGGPGSLGRPVPLGRPAKPGLKALALPALAFAPGAGAETAALFYGRDGAWYFRVRRPGGEGAFRTADLFQPGEAISPARFLEASEPVSAPAGDLPPLLNAVMAEAARLAGTACVITVVSPEFPARRVYRSPGGTGAPGAPEKAPDSPDTPEKTPDVPEKAPGVPEKAPNGGGGGVPPELFACYRPAGNGNGAAAAALFPDGRGVYGISPPEQAGPVRDGHFRLPPAEGFVYTGAALAGKLLAVSWEEQEGWALGAAGLVLVEIDW